MDKDLNVKNSSLCSFSVLVLVYKKDKAEWFEQALESITVSQTVKPTELVLVVDGPIPNSLQKIIDKYYSICSDLNVSFVVHYLKENMGQGKAAQIGVKICKYEIIARMDSDDISVPTRFEEQIKYFCVHSKVDILGGQMTEFIDEPENIVGKRIVPLEDLDIKTYLKKRCPFNQVTVMFKKSAVIKAGNYQDWFANEDYYLWIRMSLKNQIFANLESILVNVRVGNDMYKRRGGYKYFLSERKLQKYMKKNHIISNMLYFQNVVKRFIVQVVLPNAIRGWVFKKFARTK